MARNTLKHYFITLICFLILDAIWLGLIAQSFYQAQIGFLLAKNPNWLAAGAFYLLYVAGLVYFVVGPALRAGIAPGRAALRGAFFGLVAYATYDLTNLATVDRWPRCAGSSWRCRRAGSPTGSRSILGQGTPSSPRHRWLSRARPNRLGARCSRSWRKT
jgi:uncharacterized membrane protein